MAIFVYNDTDHLIPTIEDVIEETALDPARLAVLVDQHPECIYFEVLPEPESQYACAECGTRTAETYVVTTLDLEDPEGTTTEVCLPCHKALTEPADGYQAHFTALFRAVAASEPPEGSQVDDVLTEFQSTYEEAVR
jgi:hypothetical protein